MTNKLEFTATKPTGEEIDYCREGIEMDMEIGDKNNFELRVKKGAWTKEKYYYGNRLFIPLTEYGGIINDLEVITQTGEIVLRGQTWRGLLANKVIEPPKGEDHLTITGDLNDILRDLIEEPFDGLFVVLREKSGIEVEKWKVDRYITLLDAIMKLLNTHNHRLQITYIEPEGLEYGYVQISAERITDYSEVEEYSQDGRVNFDIRDYRGGINHLVCAGMGQNEERVVIHLYVQEDGSIGKKQFYFGVQERAAVYDYSNADSEKLEEEGIKKLKSLQNYKKIETTLDDTDIEIGDIVGGYEEITGTKVKKQVIKKIVKEKGGKITIECEVKGDD